MSGYENTIRAKMADIKLLADWAAIIGVGRVRDSLNIAHYELQLELERLKNDGKARHRSVGPEGK